MSEIRRQCSCGSGKDMRFCCGAPSSRKKLELEITARRLSEMGMHAEAAEILNERARLSPENPLIWNDLGVEHVAARNLEEASEAFRRALRAVSDYAPSLYNLGRLAIDRCEVEKTLELPSERRARALADEAVVYLKASLLKDPRDHRTHAALSAAYILIGDLVRAHSHSTTASELNPSERSQSKQTILQHLFSIVFKKTKAKPALPFLLSSGNEFHA